MEAKKGPQFCSFLQPASCKHASELWGLYMDSSNLYKPLVYIANILRTHMVITSYAWITDCYDHIITFVYNNNCCSVQFILLYYTSMIFPKVNTTIITLTIHVYM